MIACRHLEPLIRVLSSYTHPHSGTGYYNFDGLKVARLPGRAKVKLLRHQETRSRTDSISLNER